MPNEPTSTPLVLVVEDDDHIAQVLRFMLERQGYRVTHLADGRAASEHIATATVAPDLILLDVMLPYIDGFEIVRLVRERADWAAVPVLMLTAKNTERDTVRALDAGANDFVIKPFQPNELLARVRRFLRPAA
ncbi:MULTISPECIES: response regulator transcription factor [unclassified Massilia]|uniref:response regulator transcription factor n=1 Tax=unclassified Massilia TaxID=2609279 RepID=UPI001B81D2D9|nr:MULTISPECIES: response regulator transcription factor [unclassified Massilia]MBQ5939029.1 response regulator transcription factor [Massilia sp. AB1]MBQ5962420.1 response regulator transcription factor [Massilia sp. ZL223]